MSPLRLIFNGHKFFEVNYNKPNIEALVYKRDNNF